MRLNGSTLHLKYYSPAHTDSDISVAIPEGVQIELCGATAKAHGWGNADLLPGVKVNTDAMARTTQLVQEGFVKISK